MEFGTKVLYNSLSIYILLMKGKKPAKGFGFGDAMFAIKDVQMDYANFD